MFSPSAQCTEATNNKALLPRSLEIGALVRPHLEYGMPACSQNLVADINHLERIQRIATRFVTGMRHLPFEERLQRLGLHSLQRRRLRDDLISAFKIFRGLDPNLFLPSSSSTRPKGAPLQGTPRCEPPPKKRVGIFGEGCEILE